MAIKMIIGGKSYEEYLAEMKAKYGTLHVKRGKQVLKAGGTKIENNFEDCDLIPSGEDVLILGVAVLEIGGKQIELNGRIEMKDGMWYENGNEVKI